MRRDSLVFSAPFPSELLLQEEFLSHFLTGLINPAATIVSTLPQPASSLSSTLPKSPSEPFTSMGRSGGGEDAWQQCLQLLCLIT